MGTGQRFHLPRRGKSIGWQAEGKEFKAQHVLGITESTLNTARNQSFSSCATVKLPALSFSDATTELGSSYPSTETPDPTADLQLKASSVLLHEEFRLGADAASSTPSRRLKMYGSSSTLNSHYDAQKAPLAVSQQTSDSSRRDFALRKGAPVVVKSTTPNKDSQRQFRLFRLSKASPKFETKKEAKASSQSGSSHANNGTGPQRSLTVANHSVTSGSSLHPRVSNELSRSQKGGFFNRNSMAASVDPRKVKSPMATPLRSDVPHVKVNVRRPRVGVKHWFDGLEGDSSEDEIVDEPELQQSFVAGMEMAFEGGRIGPIPKEENRISTFIPERSGRAREDSVHSKGSKASSRHMLPSSAIPPRVSTLNAKSSRSTLSHNGSQWTGVDRPKPKANSLASTDLHHTSILDLSSSDDDEPPPGARPSPDVSLPPIRDSIAMESLLESEIEIGTAKAISTRHGAPVQAVPTVQRGYGSHSQRRVRSSFNNQSKRPDQRFTYLSDQSSEPTVEEGDLLTSFPATPVEQCSSRRASFQDHCLSDNASIESRRIMSVTKQEESLLAAMRLKKATLNDYRRGTADRRIEALKEADRKSTRQQLLPPRSLTSPEAVVPTQHHKPKFRQSLYSDGNYDQASCMTFQTGVSNEAGARLSLASFQTGTSMELETDVSSSLATLSPGLLSPTNGFNRMSRSTFFSTSTTESRDISRSRRESHHRATLEKLQQVSKRDEISSQDFIDWPYHGWEVQAKLTAAH